MFKENVLNGLSWLPLISRIVWAKNPRDLRDVTPLTNITSDVKILESLRLAFTGNGKRQK